MEWKRGRGGQEHGLRNPSTTYQRLAAYVRKSVGKSPLRKAVANNVCNRPTL